MTMIVKTTQTEATKLFADLDKPSLHALSYALRHPDTWPKSFHWNYNKCDHCAMGLAHALWDSIPEANRSDGASIMAREFAMPFGHARSIFMGGSWTPTKTEVEGCLWWKETTHVMNLHAVTPEMVADQIDAYLKTAE